MTICISLYHLFNQSHYITQTKKFATGKPSSNTASSTSLRTEWLPINVSPKQIPVDMLPNNFDENMKGLLLEEEDKQAVPTNRSNPFLLYDTDQHEKLLVRNY